MPMPKRLKQSISLSASNPILDLVKPAKERDSGQWHEVRIGTATTGAKNTSEDGGIYLSFGNDIIAHFDITNGFGRSINRGGIPENIWHHASHSLRRFQ